MNSLSPVYLLFTVSILTGCDIPWNNPYRDSESDRNIYYDSFEERPKHLDPVTSYSANEYIFLGQIYEPPLQYHFLKRPYELIPLTASRVPEPEYFNADGVPLSKDAPADQVSLVRYTINIKENIRFQPHPAFAMGNDGEYLYHALTQEQITELHSLADFAHTGTRELLAGDYVYQIKRMVHPQVHSPIAGLMSKYIAGLGELSAQLREARKNNPDQFLDLRDYNFKGARVVDPHTFEIVLKEKYPQFIYWLSMYFFSPMPWEADRFYSQAGMSDQNITLDWYPVGTGPFMLTENNPNRRMVLVRNPNFRGEPYPAQGDEQDRTAGLLQDAGRPMPFIDKAVYSLEREAIPTWNKFLQGYYDTSGIGSDSFDQAVQIGASGEASLTEEMQARDIHLLTAVTTSTFYMGFNMRDDVLGGDSERARLLRRAISIAVDYEEFISIFANGRGLSAQGPLPPGIFGHRAGKAGINPYVYEWKSGRAVRRPITQALALLEQAGYRDGRDTATGEPLVLYLDSPSAGPGSKATFDWLRKQFRKLNINLVIRATDYNRFQEKMLKGTAQIYMWGWNADYPDPENFMFLLYGPNAKVGKNGENASNYENAEFDRLFNIMKSMPNGAERQEILDQMIDVARRDAPWLWGFHPVAYSLHHSWYQNSKPNLMANNTLKYKRIDPQLRTQLRGDWNQPVWQPVLILCVVLLISLIPAIISYKRKAESRIT
ncbi:MAG: ABC transporter substrate-binding protein [Thiotrichales bacterium]|nr:ABC transporter substrate-binding protein [Thiotrichales bacterium]